MPLLALPRELLIHVVRWAARGEVNFDASMLRASVCKDLHGAVNAWMNIHDSPEDHGTIFLPIDAEVRKMRRDIIVLKMIRRSQSGSVSSEVSILLNSLMAHDEQAAFASARADSWCVRGSGVLALSDDAERVHSGGADNLIRCSAFDQFTSAIFQMAWAFLQSDAGSTRYLQGEPSTFRMHLRQPALLAAAHVIEADALRLLKASLMAAVHRGSMAESSERTHEPVEVGSNDVKLATEMLRMSHAGEGYESVPSLLTYAISRLDEHGEEVRCDMSVLLPLMVSAMPRATVDRLVCRLAKRAGIGRHTVYMIDEVWRQIVG